MIFFFFIRSLNTFIYSYLFNTKNTMDICVIFRMLAIIIFPPGAIFQNTFQDYCSLRNEYGQVQCVWANPDELIKFTKSVIGCSGYCSIVTECRQFNFRFDSKHCELFHGLRPGYSVNVSNGCSHFKVQSNQFITVDFVLH